MSVIDCEYGSTEANYVIEAEDRISLSKMPFSHWIAIKLANSDLYPQNYELRRIREKGSISESLSAANINLFDRVPIENHWFMKTLKTVAVFALACFCTPLFAVCGTLYHGSLTFKHIIILLSCHRDKVVENWTQLRHHSNGAMKDLLFTLFSIIPIAAAILGLGVSFRFLPDRMLVNPPMGSFILLPLLGTVPGFCMLSPELLAFYFGDSLPEIDAPGKDALTPASTSKHFYKSMILRREFGIVNESGGFLSHVDQSLDSDVDLYSIGFANYRYTLKGYFGDLYKNQGREFLDLFKELQTKLPQTCNLNFSYPPEVSKIVKFLDANKEATGLTEAESAVWKQKFNTLYSRMALISNLIATNFRIEINNKIYLIMGFPLNEEECQSYFNKNNDQKTCP